MYVSVGIPCDEALSSANTKFIENVALLSSFLFAAIIVAIITSKNLITNQVNLLTDAAFFDESGKPFRMVGTNNDITESKHIEKELKKSEFRFRSFIENAIDVVFSLTSEGVFTYVSPNWKDVLGYELDETIGISFVSFVHPDDVANCFAFLQLVMTTGKKQSDVEYRVLQGRYVDMVFCQWFLASVTLKTRKPHSLG